jgi:outer membrane murein-binding lipoprotein Lpp
MKRLGGAFLVLSAGLLSGLALAGGAAGTTATHTSRVRHVRGTIKVLAMDGNRIAYGVQASPSANKVAVWNVRSGRTTQVSGVLTQRTGDSGSGTGLFGLAIAGTRVAWLANVGGNIEGDDYLFTSSVTNPHERKVTWVQRTGDACSGGPPVSNPGCAGDWLLGLVGSGNVLALDRWTTAPLEQVTESARLEILGKQPKPVANDAPPFLSVDVDHGRIVVLRSAQNVVLYSPNGKVLQSIDTPETASTAALSGNNLVVLTGKRSLELYNAKTGALRKTFAMRGSVQPRNLGVQGNIAIYTTGSAIHAVNLSSGKDRVVAEHRGGPLFAQIDSAGLAHASNGYAPGKVKIVFVPFARVAAAVG